MSNQQKMQAKRPQRYAPRRVEAQARPEPVVAPLAAVTPRVPLIASSEFAAPCIVSSQRGMQNSTVDKVKISGGMCRVNVQFHGAKAAIIYFETPKNAWYNKPASIVAGRTIEGNAVVLGTTIELISAVQKTIAPSWAGLARELPKVIPLDDRAKERKLVESAERGEAWREYFDRKSRRRDGPEDPEKMTEEEEDAANAADAEFSAWVAQEDKYLASWE